VTQAAMPDLTPLAKKSLRLGRRQKTTSG